MTGNTRTRSDVKREAIIQAATQAFQEYGVNGTSMDKLAELANVSKRTVYNHFATKEDLVMHLITKQFEEAKLSITVEYDSSRDLSEQLCELVLQDIEFIVTEAHLDIARVAIGHFFYEPDKLKDEVAQLRAQETALHRWLKAAKADNKVDYDDLSRVVDEIDSLVKGQCFWPQLFKIDNELSHNDKRSIAENIVALITSRYALA
ncbi:transcriptional regulator [Alteromonas sp. KUL156]|uniref:TetR/AcrR family transcriptional regulator n=1 Tax=Alteromonas sp. KUL106 TaxID=2480799 RepID=UPI0012E5E016|nr:TetR/AcrR family transcriptional regulator [Alteromonas sp. KUL106]GFD69634.1 transcriptional regulator [Alteromonas sp. KUL106]GFD80629.1 transcriptional regulator [Tenacibaculum sp. KUL118]GFD96099.1 transcriptional regulator [Alteromonas sp. KUL154]GFE00279.1 transcriptional regulator [Alteromonas sp. KUL156]